ncbi:MAG TPA: tetratricopeptide repeat protein [Candidatus Humimicrobiaceae bacterium]|nr:tetratricopeptide repeat protein [Candidatus Humimicrobiaceae bacterium]
MNDKMILDFFLGKLNKTSLYLLLFLLPLFFLPFARSVLDYPKQSLLLFLVFLSLIGWLGKQFIQRKIIIRENKLLYLILLFLFFIFSLSAIFSLWPTASFWGWPLIISDGLLTFLCLLLLVFLFVNTFQTEREVFSALLIFLVSGALAGIFLLLQLYGIFILPSAISRIFSFNTIANVYQAILFLAVLLPISLVLAFRIKKPIFWFILLILLSSVILVDFRDAWVVLLLGVLTLAVFGLVGFQGKIRIGLTAFLGLLLVLTIFFMFFPLRPAWFPALPLQVSPGTVTELDILSGVYSGGVKNIFLGTGPGTFIFDYSQHRSPLLNLTLFWGTRFSSGGSEFLDWFITKGLLTGISLLFFLGLSIYLAFKGLIRNESPLGMRLGLLASAVALAGAGFLSPFNLSLWVVFWVVMAGLFFYNSKTREVNLDSQFRRAIFSAVLLITIIIGITLFLFQGQNYLAEIRYSRGISLSQQGDINRAIDLIQRATSLNPSADIYWRDLAQLYLVKINLIAQNQELTPEEKRMETQESIRNGIEALNHITSRFSFNVANWNVAGFFYRNLIGIEGAGEEALRSYLQAAELEPASPFPYGEIGRVYILMAQDFRERQMTDREKECLSSAIISLEKSIELKPDYAPAHYLKAVAYDQQGREEEAIVTLEELKKVSPEDIGISFQLGMLYWRIEKLDEAQREFEGIIKSDPDYSNARYMLGLVYDKKGEKEKAEEQFEKVSQLNPENQEVIRILENLKEGLSALEGIVATSDEPPIEEIPPEIQWQD